MASIAKYKRSSTGRLFLHNNRKEDDGIEHANDGIDNSRTHENYHIKKGDTEEFQNRIAEVFVPDRKDIVVLCAIIVTMQKNVKPEDEKKFFCSVYDFYCNDFGEKNIINAVVHKDEGTPHMHLDFIPVIKGDYSYEITNPFYEQMEKWKELHEGEEVERVCAYELLNREYFNSMHPRLSAYVEKDLGYEAEILNGATEHGNYSVLKLKALTLKKQIEELDEAKQYLAGEIAKMYQLAEKHGIDRESLKYLSMIEEIDRMASQIAVYKDIMKRSGITYTKEDLEKLKALKSVPKKSSMILKGSYTDESGDIAKNVVNVIELDSNNDITCSPQKKIADQPENTDLRMLFTRLKRDRDFEKGKVFLREGRKGTYCFIKPVASEELSIVLDELEKELRTFIKKKKEDGEKVRIYMDKLEQDKHDYGQMMMFSLDAEVRYYSGNWVENEDEEPERTLEKQQ